MKKGISLIVLVITIIVIVIISMSVILSVANNNPVNSAEEATFKSDLQQIQSELDLWAAKEYGDSLGTFDISTMDETLQTYAPSTSAGYLEILGVRDGKLIIDPIASQKQKDWAGQLNIEGGTIIKDTTKPVLTLSGSNPFIVAQNTTYTEPGVIASDDMDFAIQSKVVITGTVNTTTIGNYTITYNVTDAAGNVADTITRTVNVINPVTNFAYTGGYQTYTVPVTGNYKLEAWGSAGGSANQSGGAGGYAYGERNFTAGQTIYVYVGATGGLNTGGAPSDLAGGYGGASSDFRFGGQSTNNRILVAGGGGGGGGSCAGGYGGGLTGGTNANANRGYSYGGTQTAGGYNERNASPGGFGYGGAAAYGGGAGGGGNGYYGGAGGGTDYPSYHDNDDGGGGGGSSYYGSLTNAGTSAGVSYSGQAKITFLN